MSSPLRLGLFLAAALVAVVTAVFLIGDKQFLFRHTYRLNAEFKNAAGLLDGAGVRVVGIHKGTVKSIHLPGSPSGTVRVEMDLDQATQQVIKKDSVARISSEGLVGDRYVEIAPGTDEGTPIQDGDSIRGEPPFELADVMKKFDTVLESAKTAVADAGVAVGNLKDVTVKINNGQGTIGALVNDRALYQRINASATSLQEDMEALKHNFLTRGFFKNRGYDDSSQLTKYAIGRLPRQSASRKFSYHTAAIFDKPDAARLKNNKPLDELGRFLEANPFKLAVVAAYAGMKGDSEQMRTATQAQAMVIRKYLADNFRVDDRRIRTMGFGKTDGVAEGNRIEVYIYQDAGTQGYAARTAGSQR
jgi:phospholipid/cholesterol/gamma-HCH transport system substrate-binding protein